MTKKQAPSQQPVPSAETDEQNLALESYEYTEAELTNRATANTPLLQEILARSEERGYARHWGINE